MLCQGDILSIKLARCWRQFSKSRKTTFSLAEDYQTLGINEKTVKSMQFEEFAQRIQSVGTLQIVKSVLHRLENRLTLSRTAVGCGNSSFEDINHLLKHFAPQKRRSTRKGSQDPPKVSRYPVRVVLCAYMIVGHPTQVFNQRREHEDLLAEAAANFIREFELLIKIIAGGPRENTHLTSKRTLRSQLETFDAAWCSYLHYFVLWKVKDARSLEDDLVRVACEMELSMMQKCKLSAEGENHLTHDTKAVQDQVIEDHKLLREKVLRLSGDAGVQRMELALSDTRSRYFEAKKNSGAGPNNPEVVMKSSGENLSADNEVLVNEIIHEHPYALTDSLDVGNEGQNDIKVKIKETMEMAFWDCVTESLKLDKPDYGRVIELVKEVRDELCEMSPPSWEREISDAIDVEILSQVMKSGSRDLGYLGKILEFALDTLRKLSAPAKEDELIKTHKKLMTELGEISEDGEKGNSSFVIATVKGLRFVLEQIHVLKREISKARIRILEPVVKGPAGFDYLRKAFSNRYGSPVNSANSLPVTFQWLLSAQGTLEQAWNEHARSISSMSESLESANHGVPQTKLRTGGRISVASQEGRSVPVTTAGNHQPECTGNRVDKLVRHGLSRLICGSEGIAEENIPETLKLNLSRLRNAQDQFQIIIVTSITILVLRQTLLHENLSKNAADIEKAVCNSVDRLTELLDHVKDVGITNIVEAVGQSFDNHSGKLQSRKEFMANMLEKSLRPGNPVFERVSSAVQVATRGVVFGGSGVQGRKYAETALRGVGAAVLTEKLIRAAEVLIAVATISQNVHGPWYSEMINNI